MMQRLRGCGWVKAIDLPEAPIITKRLLERRWIEYDGMGRNMLVRITDEGMAAKRAPIPDTASKGMATGVVKRGNPTKGQFHQAR
jgi:hypothetical protein